MTDFFPFLQCQSFLSLLVIQHSFSATILYGLKTSLKLLFFKRFLFLVFILYVFWLFKIYLGHRGEKKKNLKLHRMLKVLSTIPEFSVSKLRPREANLTLPNLWSKKD